MVRSNASKLLRPRFGVAPPPGPRRAACRHNSTRVALALIPISFGLLQGCASSSRAPTPAPNPQRVAWEGVVDEAPWPVVRAAWRDVAAAVNRTGANHGFAVTSVQSPSPDRREFEFITMRGESGVIRFSAAWLVEGALPADPWISFEIDLGPLGDDTKRDAIRADLLRFRPAHGR